MPVVINEMNSKFDVKDEAKLKKLICKEVKAAMEAEKKKKGSNGPDPSDPSASGKPGESGGG